MFNKKDLMVLAVIIILGYFIINSLKNSVTDLFTDSEKKAMDNDLLRNVKASVKPANLSYPESVYTEYASRLYRAMDGVGTDTDQIEYVFEKMRNNDDVRQLIIAFDTKGGENLYSWLEDDLPRSSMFMFSINDINEILQKKNITVLF